MISRYSDREVDLAFADYTKYNHWLDLELAVWSARHQLGQAPAAPLLRFGVEALAEVRDLERVTGHDVGAFVRWAWDRLPSHNRRFFHQGLTSSDVVDFGLVRMLAQAQARVLDLARDAAAILDGFASSTVGPVMGRTHGQAAEQMALRVRAERWSLLVGQGIASCEATLPRWVALGGPVGDHTLYYWDIAEKVADQFGLEAVAKRGQALHRSSFIPYAEALAQLSRAFAQVALDLRLLTQTGIEEVRLHRTADHIGSTAMPHKINPIEWEKVCGLAHLVDGYVSALRATVPWWLEHDISHSSIERVAWPDLHHTVAEQAKALAGGLSTATWDTAQLNRNLQEGTHDQLRNSTDPGRAYSELAGRRRK